METCFEDIEMKDSTQHNIPYYHYFNIQIPKKRKFMDIFDNNRKNLSENNCILNKSINNRRTAKLKIDNNSNNISGSNITDSNQNYQSKEIIQKEKPKISQRKYDDKLEKIFVENYYSDEC